MHIQGIIPLGPHTIEIAHDPDLTWPADHTTEFGHTVIDRYLLVCSDEADKA